MCLYTIILTVYIEYTCAYVQNWASNNVNYMKCQLLSIFVSFSILQISMLADLFSYLFDSAIFFPIQFYIVGERKSRCFLWHTVYKEAVVLRVVDLVVVITLWNRRTAGWSCWSVALSCVMINCLSKSVPYLLFLWKFIIPATPRYSQYHSPVIGVLSAFPRFNNINTNSCLLRDFISVSGWKSNPFLQTCIRKCWLQRA